MTAPNYTTHERVYKNLCLPNDLQEALAYIAKEAEDLIEPSLCVDDCDYYENYGSVSHTQGEIQLVGWKELSPEVKAARKKAAAEAAERNRKWKQEYAASQRKRAIKDAKALLKKYPDLAEPIGEVVITNEKQASEFQRKNVARNSLKRLMKEHKGILEEIEAASVVKKKS